MNSKTFAPSALAPPGPSKASRASSAASGYTWRTIPTHEADGETTTSNRSKMSTNRRISGIASRW